MQPDAGAPTSLILVLPVELYYEIFLLLDVKDILALRQTCKRHFALVQEPDLWSMVFARLRAKQPLPCSRAEFTAMSLIQRIRLLSMASQVEATFLESRQVTRRMPPVSTTTSSWRMLGFISDRFMLSVDNHAVAIWDTSAFPPVASLASAVTPSPWAHFVLSDIICYVDCGSKLYIAASRIHKIQRSAVIYSVRLPPKDGVNHPASLQEEAAFPLREGELLKHMDPDSGRALLFCAPNVFDILHWRENDRRTRLVMSIESDDFERANWITSLRLCGPYVLCFRLRSVEACPIPLDDQTTSPLPVLRYRFRVVDCFRSLSFSHVRVSRYPSGDVYTIFLLSNDIYQGMFHYRIRVTISPAPFMSVDLLAQGGIQTSDSLSMIPGTDGRFTFQEMFSRMTVATWALGSAGLRGVWVERLRGSMDRKVVAFTTRPERLYAGSGSLAELGNAPMMKGEIVHVISSYDLRDDVTVCAVSEWTGRIALLSRAGSILLI